MEIKDFKMKCENIPQRDEVVKVLEENGVKISPITHEGLVIAVNNGIYQLLEVDFFEIYIPQKLILTYSEFMQLYAEPKQDELVELKNWINDTFDMGMDGILEINGKINEIIERRSDGKTN